MHAPKALVKTPRIVYWKPFCVLQSTHNSGPVKENSKKSVNCLRILKLYNYSATSIMNHSNQTKFQ